MKLFTTITPELTACWNACTEKNHLQTPFFTRVWHELTSQTFGETPWIIVDQNVLIPLVKTTTTLSFSGNKEIADYLDAIGEEINKPQVWEQTITTAKKEGVNKIILHNIPDSSATLTYFRSIQTSIPNKVTITQEDTTPYLSLPETWETYLSSLSRKDRHELKRKLRKFENEHQAIYLTKETNLIKGIDDLCKLMKLNPEKNTFLSPTMISFFQKLPAAFSQTLSFLTLQDNSNTIASILFFVQNNTLYLYNSGFDETAYTGSGFYLKAKSIEWAIKQKLTIYNFLQGNERYKYDLGAKDFPVWSVTVTL